MKGEALKRAGEVSLVHVINKLKDDVINRLSDDQLEAYMGEKTTFQRQLEKKFGSGCDICQDTLEWHLVVGSTPPFDSEPALESEQAAVRELIREEVRKFVTRLREKYLPEATD